MAAVCVCEELLNLDVTEPADVIEVLRAASERYRDLSGDFPLVARVLDSAADRIEQIL